MVRRAESLVVGVTAAIVTRRSTSGAETAALSASRSSAPGGGRLPAPDQSLSSVASQSQPVYPLYDAAEPDRARTIPCENDVAVLCRR